MKIHYVKCFGLLLAFLCVNTYAQPPSICSTIVTLVCSNPNPGGPGSGLVCYGQTASGVQVNGWAVSVVDGSVNCPATYGLSYCGPYPFYSSYQWMNSNYYCFAPSSSSS